MSRQRSAFTLVELVAATTLTALMMLAVAGTLRAMLRHERPLRPHSPISRTVKDRLRQDLIVSRRFYLIPTRLVLLGYGSHDSRTGTVTLLPTEIEYRIVAVADESWLIRTERHLGQERETRRELLCSGVSQIAGRRLNDGLDLAASATGRQEFSPVPQGIVISLSCRDSHAERIVLGPSDIRK